MVDGVCVQHRVHIHEVCIDQQQPILVLGKVFDGFRLQLV